ncbi:hypothetical protein SLS62_005747 [Diatrype stigma]|uniref:Survival protein SurE-like phosphatase/nucleotidase domain-containing protein n=1 Tax=Diatrype stigma TaxID=117547 RepID=A0AAN9V284_9PEZI
MHILVTNDDGPPSPTSSPYVHSLVRELQKAGHTVSVCLPHGQRSWIGKAHMIGQTVKPLYYRPSAEFDPTPAAASKVQGTTHTRPSSSQGDDQVEEEWILVDGTPASAAQIGLHHGGSLFRAGRGPVDLVVSGPNYGRNTTAVFALSSGTLGGALEAAVCRRRAIALSYAHATKNHNHDPAVIAAAARHAVRVVEALHARWPADGSVDVYTVNVPLVEGVGGPEHRTLFAPMLQNYWGTPDGEGRDSSCFQEIEVEEGEENGDEAEERIREGKEVREVAGGGDSAPNSNGTEQQQQQQKKGKAALRHFKWAPQFKDVYRSVEESPPGNDGWCVKEGHTSITPLKANFWHSATDLHGTELKLGPMSTLAFRPKAHFFALVAYEDAYVQPLILAALQKLFPPESYTLLSAPPSSTTTINSEISLSKLLPNGDSDGDGHRILQITPYEAIDWDFAAAHPRTCLVNSYMLRKALIRKHYLAATVAHWTSKRPASALRRHVVQPSEAFELDYAEFLDDALVEAFDLRASLERNASKLGDSGGGDGDGGNEGEGKGEDLEWWILKPSMSDRGQGIRLFCTMEELQAIFDEWEEDQPESDDDDEADGNGSEGDENAAAAATAGDDGERDYITASHLRHFVAQPYIHPPLLLPGDGRKFHIRTYVACIGSLDVYVYRQMLALFAGRPYTAPARGSTSTSTTAATTNSAVGLESHLTNTCLQRSVAEGTVRRFWDLDLAADRKAEIFAQICEVAGELFEAAARGMLMHFRPLPNAFELYGVDFLVDAAGRPWLLEVNAFPDFRQTGDDLRDLVAGLWEGVLERAVAPFFFGGGEGGRGRDGEEGRPGNGNGNGNGGEEEGLVHVRRVDLLGNQ